MAGRAAGTCPASRSPPRARGPDPTHVRRSPPGRIVRRRATSASTSPRSVSRPSMTYRRSSGREHGVRPVKPLPRSETRTQGSGRLGPLHAVRGGQLRHGRDATGSREQIRAAIPWTRTATSWRYGAVAGPGRTRRVRSRSAGGRAGGRFERAGRVPRVGDAVQPERPVERPVLADRGKAHTDIAPCGSHSGSTTRTAPGSGSNGCGWERAAAWTTQHSRWVLAERPRSGRLRQGGFGELGY